MLLPNFWKSTNTSKKITSEKSAPPPVWFTRNSMTSWDCSLFKLRWEYGTWWDSLKFTSSGKSEALKQMGVELIIRGPSKPSAVEFCHILLMATWVGIGWPQMWSDLRFLHFIPRTKLWKWIIYKVDNFATINWGQWTLLLTSTFYIYAVYQFVFRASWGFHLTGREKTWLIDWQEGELHDRDRLEVGAKNFEIGLNRRRLV